MRGQRPPLRLLLLRRLAAQHAKPSQHSGVLGFTTSRFTTLVVNPPNQATRAIDVRACKCVLAFPNSELIIARRTSHAPSHTQTSSVGSHPNFVGLMQCTSARAGRRGPGGRRVRTRVDDGARRRGATASRHIGEPSATHWWC